jgi:hypothetical protein
MREIYWRIERYDSSRKIYDRKFKAAYFSEKKIQALLMALAANAGLNFDEIVGAYAKKGTQIEPTLGQIRRRGMLTL